MFLSAFFLSMQTFGLQAFLYPILIFKSIFSPSSANNPSHHKQIIFIGLILLGIFILVIKDVSTSNLISLFRFYLGLLLVLYIFLIKNVVVFKRSAFIFVSLLVVVEMLSFAIGIQPFFYSFFTNSADVNYLERAVVDSGIYRAYGFALNSSISSSILAIIFFMTIDQTAKFRANDYLFIGLIMFCFLSCGSTTGYIVFIFILISKYFKKIKINIFLYILIGLSLAGVGFSSSEFLHSIYSRKLSEEYISFIYEFKMQQISDGISYSDILFGISLSNLDSDSIGGDFVLLSFIQYFGLIYVLLIISWLFYCCPSELRIYLAAGTFASLHYGTIFSISGQLFFASLIANKINLSK
jgi:hypothetical protein